MSTTEQQLPGPVLEYLREHNTLTLATASGSGIPRAATFLYVNEGPSLYFWSKGSAISARHIQQNPMVAFTVDDYATDLTQTRGVQGMGQCSMILDGTEVARVADIFGQKFPALAPGTTMSISFFRLIPTEIEFIDNTGSISGQAGMFGAEFHRERSFSVLAALPPQATTTISASLQPLNAEADTVIARQGGPADKFFIVVDGEIEISREEGGSTQTVSTLGPGELFGEMAVLFDRPRGASARTTKPSKLLVMDGPTFRDIVAQALGTTADFDQVIRERLGVHGG